MPSVFDEHTSTSHRKYSVPPLRHVLISFEASWNSLDVATFNVTSTWHQKWATSYIINSPSTWSWFSVNTEALGFKHGLMCSSLRRWFLCLHWHTLVLTPKRDQAVYLDATKLGQLNKKWNTCIHLQFLLDKLRSWFLCLQWHGFVLTSKIEQAVIWMLQKIPKMGQSNKKWNTRVGHLWFSMDKLLL